MKYPILATKFAIPFAIHRGTDNTGNVIITTTINSLTSFGLLFSGNVGTNGNWVSLCI